MSGMHTVIDLVSFFFVSHQAEASCLCHAMRVKFAS